MGGNSRRKKKSKRSVTGAAKPTYGQLFDELESLDTVQARIDCIAKDINSKKNRYAALQVDDLAGLLDVDISPQPDGWDRTFWGYRGPEPSFEDAIKPRATRIDDIAHLVPDEGYALLARKAQAIIDSKQSSDLTSDDIVKVFMKVPPKALNQIMRQKWKEELARSWSRYMSFWVSKYLLPSIRERYRKKYPDHDKKVELSRHTATGEVAPPDAEQILAIRGFGPKGMFPLIRQAALHLLAFHKESSLTNECFNKYLSNDIVKLLATLPKETLYRAIRSMKNPRERTDDMPAFEFRDFEKYVRKDDRWRNAIKDLVKNSVMPEFEEAYYEEYPNAPQPGWTPEHTDIIFSFTSVQASDGTDLNFEALEEYNYTGDFRSPYDIEAGNGHDMSEYAQLH